MAVCELGGDQMYSPLDYQAINLIEGTHKPSTKILNSWSFNYWCRSLFHRAISVIDFTIPWIGGQRDSILYWLFRNGFVSVFDTVDYGLIAQECTLGGYTIYLQPAYFIIANPYSDKISGIYGIGDAVVDNAIGSGELLKLTPDFRGVWDIITYYASKLALLSQAIDISIDVNKTPNILGARSKAGAETLKKVIDKVNEGNSLVVYDKAIGDDDTDPFISVYRDHIKDSYITDLQLRDIQTLLNMFDGEVGIPTTPQDKKERMVTYEATSRVADSQSRLRVWVKSLNNSMEVINKRYGTSMSADINKEVLQYGIVNDDNSRTTSIFTT